MTNDCPDHITPSSGCLAEIESCALPTPKSLGFNCPSPSLVLSTSQPSTLASKPDRHHTGPLTKPVSGRAPRACLGCRSRKVRCDVTRRWPCGNCQWSDRACIVRDRRPRKYVSPISISLKYPTLSISTRWHY